MKLAFLQLANRITGISTPVFGVQWTPPLLDTDVARSLVTYLEDRRVLFVHHDREIPSYAVESVIRIRERLTEALERVDRTSALGESLVAMRAACRKFLDREQGLMLGPMLRRGWGPGRDFDILDVDKMVFFSALGELRGMFGIHIARIAVSYGIDVEEELAAILPAPPDDE